MAKIIELSYRIYSTLLYNRELLPSVFVIAATTAATAVAAAVIHIVVLVFVAVGLLFLSSNIFFSFIFSQTHFMHGYYKFFQIDFCSFRTLFNE